MKLVSCVTLKVTLFLCFCLTGLTSFAQNPEKEVVQITLEGSDMDSFSLQVDGNNVLINGRKPEDLGISLNISRQKAGKGGTSSAAYGHINMMPPAERGQPYFGIVTHEVDKGLQIIEVNPLGPAKRAKLRVGDKILMIDGVRLSTHSQLVDYISTKFPGDVISVKYERGEKTNIVDVVLGVRSSTAVAGGKYPAESVYQRPKSLGIKMRESVDGKTWKVIEVAPGSAGEVAGIRANDVILEMNGIKIDSAADVDKVMKSSSTDQGILVKVRRIKEIINLEIK